nr:MAG TPA: hypothetical protein [Caudoviricetes sp.]
MLENFCHPIVGWFTWGDDYLNDHSCEHFIREIKQHIHNFFD